MTHPTSAPAPANRFGCQNLGFGVGLRPVHYGHILGEKPPVDWFEIISENYMDTAGRPLYMLEQIAERYPIVMHGVCLSIGSTDALDFEYLRKLKTLAERVDSPWISDHVCWTGVAGRNMHDLLPVPTTEESLRHMISRIRAVQDFLGRPIALENPSTYVEFAGSTIPEADFIAAMAEEADCMLLLDVNNVYVSSFNHGFDAVEYIEKMPADRIVQFHLAGHSNCGTHIVDTHDDHVIPEVWELYKLAHARTGGRSTLLEWDANIPEFDVVHAEVLKARDLVGPQMAPNALTEMSRAGHND